MLAEAIEKLESIVGRADGVEVRDHPCLPGKVLIRQGDRVDVIDQPRTTRTSVVSDYDSFVRAVTDDGIRPTDTSFGAAEHDPPPSRNPAVWHDDGFARLLVDRDDRRESVILNLVTSDRFQVVRGLTAGRKVAPRDAVRFMRFELHGTGTEEVSRALGRLDFTRTSTGRSHVEHGKESLGRSVESAVQQADKVPEEFVVRLPVYTNPGLKALTTVDVRVGVYVDLDAEMVELRTLSDEVQGAIDAAQTAIGERLAQDIGDVPIYRGHP